MNLAMRFPNQDSPFLTACITAEGSYDLANFRTNTLMSTTATTTERLQGDGVNSARAQSRGLLAASAGVLARSDARRKGSQSST
ncbi:MAG: hypothetical protein HYY24_27225 [Verrucomicrobia bacterium]|nr:hypothetical protein [Verrucomicrobiota bacterium]